jgi:hypothetical protein
MSALLKRIAARQAQLEQHSFCKHLSNRRDVSAQAYSFVPHMTFFVLGFRDILEEIRVDNPKTELELSINTHCSEDSNHWLWFIEDLKTLDMGVDYWGGDLSSVLKTLWSTDNYPIREMVYRVVSHIRNTKTAEEKMMILDCLESAFSVFINNLNYVTQARGDYEKLKYFGSEHYEDEASHSTGNWLEGEKHGGQSHYYDVQRFRAAHMSTVIDDIFDGFDQIFDCWYKAVKHKSYAEMSVAS